MQKRCIARNRARVATLIFGISLILLASFAYAITVKEIHLKFKATYEQTKNFSADFEQTTHHQNRRSIVKGKLVFEKPNLLRLEYFDSTNPEELVQLIVSDGKTSWSYTPYLEQVNKTEAKGKELLPGVGKSFEQLPKNYNMELVPDDVANPKGIYRVKLFLKDAASQTATRDKQQNSQLMESLEVWIHSKDWTPVQFSYTIPSHNMLVITALKNIKLNQKLNKDTFTFTVPKGVEVIDLSP